MTIRNDTKEPDLDKLSIAEFTSTLGSSSPAPGGGSTAAAAGAMAAALVSMVAKITLKHNTSELTQKRLKTIMNSANQIREEFLILINEDSAAFNVIMASFHLPKTNDIEKHERSSAIQAATKHAAEVPCSTAQLGLKTLNLIDKLTEIGSEQAITDTGVAGLMAYSAIIGASWNVRINLSSIKDEAFVQKTSTEIDLISGSAKNIWLEIVEKIENKI